ncbi:MAG: hypothetical protein QXX38_01325 [Candidatus Aenigmatarchaeota archaeon]
MVNSQIKLNSSEDDINTTSDKKIKNFVIITTSISRYLYNLAKSEQIKWSRAIEVGIKTILQNRNELREIKQNFDDKITKLEKNNSYIQNKLWKLIAVLKEKGILGKGEYL